MPEDVELAEIRAFLAGVAPFRHLPESVLDALPRTLTMQYARRRSAVMAVGRDNHHLYIVRSGAVDVFNEAGTLVDRGGVGTCFGSTTLVRGNPSRFDVRAIEDCLLLVMEADTFAALTSEHEAFKGFFDTQRAHRMRDAVAALHLSETGAAVLKARARDLANRPIVAVRRDTSIRDTAATMTAERVSSVLVLDGERVEGIVTDRDLRTRVVAAGRDTTQPVSAIMTVDPMTADADAAVFELIIDMVGAGIHHLPILEAGRPIGMITTNDAIRLEQSNPLFLTRDISRQKTVAGVAAAGRRLPELVASLVRQDGTADDIQRIVTAVGDRVDRQLIAFAEAELGPPPIPYAWVVMGSRARLEQALAADQDNALILDDAYDEAAHGAYFRDLATFVRDALVECGYPACPGDVMATNDRWRVPARTWRGYFDEWMHRPTSEAVLQASIFFDMRVVHGAANLYEELAGFVSRVAPLSTLFLGHMTKHAVEDGPPIGFFRGLVVEKHGLHRDTFDIKAGGVRAVVEIARVTALKNGSRQLNTRARLDEAIAGGTMDRSRGEDLRDAFEFLSYVRLRHQAAQVRAGREPDNHVSPHSLSDFEQQHLRQAFAIVSRAQRTLSQLHSVPFMR